MNLYPLQSTYFRLHFFHYLTILFLISSPNINRGKTAVDLLPVLHKRVVSWIQTSEIQEIQGNL